MKRPQSSGGSTRSRVIPAQTLSNNSNQNYIPSSSSSSSSRGRSATPQQQHPLLISSSKYNSSDLSIRGLNTNPKFNSSEDRLRLEAKNLINKWTRYNDEGESSSSNSTNLIQDNLILAVNTSSQNTISNFNNSNTNNTNTSMSVRKSNNYTTNKSIIIQDIDPTLMNGNINATPLMDRIKDKKPSQLSKWEKLRLSMERKKNIVDLNVLQPTFESKIQLVVKNDLISSPTLQDNDYMNGGSNDSTLAFQRSSSPSSSSMIARQENDIPFSTIQLTTNNTTKQDTIDSLFNYKPFSSEMTGHSIEKPKFNDFQLPSSSTMNHLINNSLDQQMNIFKTKLMGTNYLNTTSTTTNTTNTTNTNNTPQSSNLNIKNNSTLSTTSKTKNREQRIIEIPTLTTTTTTTGQQQASSNYVTTQKEIFLAENEKRKAEEEVLKIKKQIEEEKSKLKQVQQIKKEELKSIKQNQQM